VNAVAPSSSSSSSSCSDQVQLGVAALHYNYGRYTAAYDTMKEALPTSQCYLTRLAMEADMAYCIAAAHHCRSSWMQSRSNQVHGKSKKLKVGNSDNSSLWSQAIRAQIGYRDALKHQFSNKISMFKDEDRGKFSRNGLMIREYAASMVVCAVKEVHLNMKMGNVNEANYSFSTAVKAAAAWLSMMKSSSPISPSFTSSSMTLNEAVFVVENSLVPSDTNVNNITQCERFQHAVHQMTHTRNILLLVDQNKYSQFEGQVNKCNTRLDDRKICIRESSSVEERLFHIISNFLERLSDTRTFLDNLENIYTMFPDNQLCRRLKYSLDGHNMICLNSKCCLKSLESLSMIDISVANILGCILFKEQKVVEALKLFQRILSLGRDKLTNKGVSYIDVVVNASLCFVELKDHKSAADLMLYAYSLYLQDSCGKEDEINVACSSFELTIRGSSSGEEVLSINALLWELYKCLSYMGEWETCSTICEILTNDISSHTHDLTCLKIFTCLQYEKPERALLVIAEWENEDCPDIYKLFRCMFKFDANMKLEKPLLRTVVHAATTSLLQLNSTGLITNINLQMLLHNNQAIIHLLDGKQDLALIHFRNAVQEKSFRNKGINLRPFFNLTLALWKLGQLHDAAVIWMTAIGVHDDLKQAKKGNIKTIKSRFQELISRHCMHKSKNSNEKSSRMDDIDGLQRATIDILIYNHIIRNGRKLPSSLIT